MPRGQSVRTNQLSLFSVRPVGQSSTGGKNGRLRDSRAADQLRRCEVALARQRIAEMPPIRRCPVCDGMELVNTPHNHERKAA